jgi:hypothetical protein
LPIGPGIGALGVPFKAASILRRNLSARTKESFIEEEATGLRIITTTSAPIIYGTDLIRLSKKSTNLVEKMKDSVNSNNPTDNGIVGNFIKKAESWGLKQASKLGIAFPSTTIPTTIVLNPEFKAGKEPNTMVTLAKIKNDSKGTLVGQFLAKNVKGTPKQIGNAVLGAGIDLLKSTVKKKLFGSPKQGAQNLAKKGDNEVQYDSSTFYSSTINPNDEDYFKRNDLSSILVAKDTKEAGGGIDVKTKVNELVPKSKGIGDSPKEALNTGKNIFAGVGDKLKNAKEGIQSKLGEAKKQGQQLIADGKAKVGDTKPDATATTPDPVIRYEDTVDETADDITLRNDLSTKLDAFMAASTSLKEGDKGYSVSRSDVTTNAYSTLKNSKKDPKVTLRTKLGIDSADKSDFLNDKMPYDDDPKSIKGLKLSDGTFLDDYDFVTLKFKSIATGRAVNFRATVSGISESVSPSWDSAKFIGSPFNYYTYSGIERSVTFNFKVYSTTPLQHIAGWQRINFLTSLAYPQGYGKSGVYVVPPFLKFTLGNLYKNKECFIESLGYDIDDNTPWHVGFTENKGYNADGTSIPNYADDVKFKLDGDETSMNNYVLPKIINVSITLKFVESKSTTSGGRMYGFNKLPKIKDAVSIDATSKSNEIAADSNNTAPLELATPPQPETKLPKKKTESFNAPTNSPGESNGKVEKDTTEITSIPSFGDMSTDPSGNNSDLNNMGGDYGSGFGGGFGGFGSFG